MQRRFVALALMVAFAAGACSSGGGSSPAQPSTAPSEGTSAASSPAVSDFDRAFIDMMVPHHQAAVEMARIAQERGEHPELIQLADEIVAAQEGEIAQLKEWRQAWFGSADTPPMDAMPMLPGMDMEGHDMGTTTMDMTMDIDALRTAEPFDQAFIEAMIPHHESAIAAAELALDQAGSPEIKSLAEEIIDAQRREIDQMQTWLESWG
jgi:uncharacterized protein (DUF305 family)